MRNKLLYILFAFIFSKLSFSQFNQNMYDFTGNTYSLKYNPGMKLDNDIKFYMNLPFIPFYSGANISVHTSVLNASKIFDKNKTITETLRGLSSEGTRSDFIGFNSEITLLDLGFKWYDKYNKAKWLFTFSFNINSYAYSFYPKSVINFLSKGMKRGTIIDLSDLSGSASLYTSYDFGVNYRKDNSPLTLGAKLKIYNSLYSAKVENNSYMQSVSNDLVSGLNFKGDVRIHRTSLPDSIDVSYISNVFFSGNMGAGVDLGLTYDITKNWTITTSLLNFGFIRNSGETDIIEKEVSYGGPNLSDNSNSGGFKAFGDSIAGIVKNTETIKGSSFTTYLPTTFNFGVKYTLYSKPIKTKIVNEDCENCAYKSEEFIPKQSFGVQIHTLFKEWRGYSALSLTYHNHMEENIEFKASYTLERYNYYNLGFAVIFKKGAYNFFISSENLLGYTNLYNSNSQSFTMGVYFNIVE